MLKGLGNSGHHLPSQVDNILCFELDNVPYTYVMCDNKWSIMALTLCMLKFIRLHREQKVLTAKEKLCLEQFLKGLILLLRS